MNFLAEMILPGLLRASLGLAAAAVVVLVLTRLFRLRSPKAEQCAWGIVLLQGLLLFPLMISIPVTPAATPTNVSQPEAPPPEVREPMPAAPEPSRESERVAVAEEVMTEHQPIVEPDVDSAEHLPSPAKVSWSAIGLVVWLVGIASLMLLGLVRYLRFVRQVNYTLPAERQWESLWERLLADRGIRKSIPLAVTGELGPAMCLLPSGYRLVVPQSLWRELTASQQASIMRHELAHYTRGDVWWAMAARSVALLHWFNPLAWWASSNFVAQAEYLCDSAAAGQDPTSFAEVLIRLGTSGRTSPLATQSIGAGSLFGRVRRLLSEQSGSPRWRSGVVITIAICGILAAGLRFETVAKSQEKAESPPPVAARSESQKTARMLLQLGTNNLRTRGFIRDIAFSPDGKLIAASPANGPTPRVWLFDVSTGKEANRIIPADKPAGWINCIAFSPDQRFLLWGEIMGFVALWDLRNDRLLFRTKLHERSVNDVSFSTQGRLWASAGSDGTVQLRKTVNPELELKELGSADGGPSGSFESFGSSGVVSVTFTPDDQRVITASGAGGEIQIWRVSNGMLERRIDTASESPDNGSGWELKSATVTPDGRAVMTAGNRTVPRTETPIPYGANNVRLTEIRIWDIASGALQRSINGQFDHGFGFAALSSDGQRVAAGEFSQLRILNAMSGAVEQKISLPGSWGRQPQFSPDGRLVAMAIHNTVALFDASTGKRLHHDETTPVSEMRSAAWSPAGDRIVTGHSDGGVRVWNGDTGALQWHQTLAPVVSPSGGNAAPTFVAFTPNGHRVVVAGRRDDPVEYREGIVAVFNAQRGLPIRRTFLNRDVRHAALSNDGRFLVAATSNGAADDTRLHGIELETGREVYINPPEARRGALWQMEAMRFRPMSNTLDVALGNGQVMQFDGRTGTVERRFLAEWRTALQQRARRPRRPDLWEGVFSPDGNTLVTSAAEYVYIWDVESAKLRRKIRHPHDHGCRLAIAPDGNTIATADLQYAGDYGVDTVRLYDIESGEEILQLHPGDNRAVVLRFSPDGTKLFTGFARGSAAIWDVRR